MHFFCSWALTHFLPEATFLVINTTALSLDPIEASPCSLVFSYATLFQHPLRLHQLELPAWSLPRLLSSAQLSSPLLTDSCCLPYRNYIAVFWLSRLGFCVPLIYFYSISLLLWCWLLENWIHDRFLIIFLCPSFLPPWHSIFNLFFLPSLSPTPSVPATVVEWSKDTLAFWETWPNI